MRRVESDADAVDEEGDGQPPCGTFDTEGEHDADDAEDLQHHADPDESRRSHERGDMARCATGDDGTDTEDGDESSGVQRAEALHGLQPQGQRKKYAEFAQ